MKKKLNIYCSLIFLVILLLIGKTGFEVGLGFYAGMKAATEKGVCLKEQEHSKSLITSQGVTAVSYTLPVTALFRPDSVMNAKTGEYIPALYTQLLVQTDTKPDKMHGFLSGLSLFISLVSIVVVLVFFVKLILLINKSVIFDWVNVRRLRFMGIGLLVSYFANAFHLMQDYMLVKSSVELDGYMHYPAFVDDFTFLFLGLGSMVVAEAFAIGLKMKEEQELTI